MFLEFGMEGAEFGSPISHHDPLEIRFSEHREDVECVTGCDHTLGEGRSSWSKRIKVEPWFTPAGRRVEKLICGEQAIHPQASPGLARMDGIKRFRFVVEGVTALGGLGWGLKPATRQATIDQRGHNLPCGLIDRRHRTVSRLRPRPPCKPHPRSPDGALGGGG